LIAREKITGEGMTRITRLALLGALLLFFPMTAAADEMRPEDHELNPNPPRDLSGENLTLTTADGKPFQVYATGPSDAKRGILVIHEWWGLNDHIRGWADRFAGLGYRAMAIDLYDGVVAATAEEAMRSMQSVNQEEANAKYRAAFNALMVPGRKLAVIGWCFGGGQSLQASLADPDSVSATVIYYGPLITDATKLSTLKGPILGIFAQRDMSITVEKVKAFEAAMVQAGKKLSLHFYDADHAFANPSGNRYNGDAAKAAWEVTRAFLDEQLR
jgi:carboxymethylenebutenolidase